MTVNKPHGVSMTACTLAALLLADPYHVGAVPDAVPPAAREWSTVNGDIGNSRYSALAQINRQTVSRLAGAWTSATFDDAPSGRAMPVVTDGLLFITAGSWVYAYDAKTGATKWRHQFGRPPSSGALAEFNRVENRLPSREGVAVGDGLVFVGTSDAHVVAVREKTGEIVWDEFVGTAPPRPGQGSSAAPVYANGIVMAGFAADFGFRGKVVGLDAKTGHKVWEWFAIPGPGEPGHETWPADNDSWRTGGGAVWLAGAVDPSLGLVYFGTGNGVPQYGGDVRAGDNLYLCSVVALDIKTGKLRWHYQTIHHDIWEADIAVSPVLYEARVANRARPAVAAMRADGFLFLLDRETGKPLVPVEERPVPQDARGRTARTQPFPVGAERMLPDCDTWKSASIPSGFVLGCFFAPASLDHPNLLTPSWGMRVTPMSYSPQTGFFYAIGNASLQWFRRTEDPYVFILGSNRTPGLPVGHAVMAAIDSRTDRIAWKKEFRGGRPSAALTTAGGLLFQTMPDANFTALDAGTGDVVWQFQTGSTLGGAAAAYEIDGEEYLALALRTGVMAFRLGGPLSQSPAPSAPVASTEQAFAGPIEDANQIEVASEVRDNSASAPHYYTDEYAFSPYRTRVKAGTAVRWINNGHTAHTIAAADGSWTTRRLAPLEADAIVFEKPGTYAYFCKDHPWAKAQLIVVP